jgi:hypothetical protein
VGPTADLDVVVNSFYLKDFSMWLILNVQPGLYGRCSNGGSTDPLLPNRTQNSTQISPPYDFWTFPTMERELRGKKFRSDQRSARSGWSVVRSASLAKGGTSKKRPSSHLHKVPTRSYKVSPGTLQTSLLHGVCDVLCICNKQTSETRYENNREPIWKICVLHWPNPCNFPFQYKTVRSTCTVCVGIGRLTYGNLPDFVSKFQILRD